MIKNHLCSTALNKTINYSAWQLKLNIINMTYGCTVLYLHMKEKVPVTKCCPCILWKIGYITCTCTSNHHYIIWLNHIISLDCVGLCEIWLKRKKFKLIAAIQKCKLGYFLHIPSDMPIFVLNRKHFPQVKWS